MILHKRIHIRGRVQGVFFRASTVETARQLALTGWVQNEPDGSVKVAVEGDEAAMSQFIAWCRQGPPQARVDDVQVMKGEVVGFRAFKIQR